LSYQQEPVSITETAPAKARLSPGRLLDLVEQGEEIAISRRGEVVAHLIPALGSTKLIDPEDARAAMARICARAKEMKLGPFDWEEWKSYRDEGRR
jgi:antitoxin (DNA-binding transcriptional repressor) of toxin-antitoxin stability system